MDEKSALESGAGPSSGGGGSSASLLGARPSKPDSTAPADQPPVDPQAAAKAEARRKAVEQQQAALAKLNAELIQKEVNIKWHTLAWVILACLSVALSGASVNPFGLAHSVCYLVIGVIVYFLISWTSSKRIDFLFIFLAIDLFFIITEVFLAIVVAVTLGINAALIEFLGLLVACCVVLFVTTIYHIFCFILLRNIYLLMRKAQILSFKLRGKTLQRRRSSRAANFVSSV